MMPEHEEVTREEIKKEFQLERMILFSDAVFAIVITLMAIEIRVPEDITNPTWDVILHHLFPVLMAYTVSFIFIGVTWYNHLKLFGLLKDYDKGLVIRNLLLLFFVGLFPFGASMVTRFKSQNMGFFIYLAIILLCILVQYILQYYIVVQRPSIRINADMEKPLLELRKRKKLVISFYLISALITITYFLIPDEDLRGLASLWMLLLPIFNRKMTRKVD